jgi:hypothetical protein
MNKLNEILSIIDSYVGGSQWFVFLLLGTGLFFTIYLKFPQFRYLKFSLRIVRGKFDKAGDVGDTSHFQALTTALSGTVGTGNIAGVALAIHLGGPAALFWMLVTAAVGMTTKFVEVTLSHKYREIAARWFCFRRTDVLYEKPVEASLAGGDFCSCHGFIFFRHRKFAANQQYFKFHVRNIWNKPHVNRRDTCCTFGFCDHWRN